jgi:hypothetical protein
LQIADNPVQPHAHRLFAPLQHVALSRYRRQLSGLGLSVLLQVADARVLLMLAHGHGTFQPIHGAFQARKSACDIGHGIPSCKSTSVRPLLP